jgi:hypothetical protein
VFLNGSSAGIQAETTMVKMRGAAVSHAARGGPMLIGRNHAGTLAMLWMADALLLLLLAPSNPDGRALLIAFLLWIVPTTALAAATWRRWRHARR